MPLTFLYGTHSIRPRYKKLFGPFDSKKDWIALDLQQRILASFANPNIGRTLSNYLLSAGYDVRVVPDAASAHEAFFQWSPDVVVCHHSPPAIDGVALCRQLRPLSNVPILFLGSADHAVSKTEALNAGADDCVSASADLNIDEILATLRVLLRRHGAPQRQADGPLEIGAFKVVESTHRCIVSGRPVHLTTKEFALLLVFMRSVQRVMTHQQIARMIWPGEQGIGPESLRPLILQLRKKIEPDWRQPTHILTEHKIGYRFNPSSDYTA